MNEACAAVGAGTMRPVEWQREIDALLTRVDMADLLKAISFEALSKLPSLPPDRESTTRIRFYEDARGLAGPHYFSAYLFCLKKDVSVVPHGHHNMVTMHMMLKGLAHARHFDRLADDGDHMIIRPTSDKVIEPGEVTSISDDKDNIHWFRALTEPVFMFNIGMHRVVADKPSGARDYVDPLRGNKLGDGSIRAARLDQQQAYALYGRA